jgi:tetratricopeptide (TPR) repeat protein
MKGEPVLNQLGKTTLAAAVLALGIAAAVPAHAQFASPTGDRGPVNTTFGGNYKDPQQRAADNLAKGLRFKAKADGEKDAKKKEKLLEKAKKEFQSSIALHPNHDAYLALGLVQIALGQNQSGAEACHQALGLQPGSEAAQTCIQTALNPPPATTQPAAVSNGGGSN